ncbi:centriolin-like [Ylistrum balloti]|uniref:centriolin-like n=1 Tax=Ylistrum balloti TaxID=509963 RepID=UPI0029058DF2|nr:centriolin-like [Ylistrum balloti]
MGRKIDRVLRLFNKRNLLREVNVKQDALLRRISQLSIDQAGHGEYKAKMEESEKQLKQRLEKGQKRERKLEAEIQELTNKLHQLDLEVVRLSMANQHLTKDKSRLSHQLDESQESLNECRHRENVLERHKADLKEECCKQIDLLRERERRLEKSELDLEKLNSELGIKEEMLQKVTKDRSKLLVYMKKQTGRHEEQLRLIREQFRRRLAHAYKDRKAGKPSPLTTNGNEILVTRLMEAEFKVYRRERLVDVLADRLRQYENDFDVVTASDCAPYLDEDYKCTSIADLARGENFTQDLTCTDDTESPHTD